MAYDKAVDSGVLDAGLTSIADAIRTKGGTSDAMAFPAGFVAAIEAIETGGTLKYATGKTTSGTAKNVTVTGLAFTPVFAFFYSESGPSLSAGTADISYSTYYSNKFTNTLTITEGGFTFAASGNIKGGAATWHAYGY